MNVERLLASLKVQRTLAIRKVERLLAIIESTKLPARVHYAVRGAAVAVVIVVASVVVLAGRVGAATSTPEPEVVSGPAPVVKAVADKKLESSAEPQLITIVGTAFVKGMTARLVSPFDEDVSTFPASALEQLTPTSFQLRATLTEVGAYELTVRGPSGARSNALMLQVKRAATKR